MIHDVASRLPVTDFAKVIIHALPIEVERKRPSHVLRHQDLVLIRQIRVGNRCEMLVVVNVMLQITLAVVLLIHIPVLLGDAPPKRIKNVVCLKLAHRPKEPAMIPAGFKVRELPIRAVGKPFGKHPIPALNAHHISKTIRVARKGIHLVRNNPIGDEITRAQANPACDYP